MFLGSAAARPDAAPAEATGPACALAMVVLAGLCVVIGLGGFALVPRLAPAVRQLTGLTAGGAAAVLGCDVGRILLAVRLLGAVFLLLVLVLAACGRGWLRGREVGSPPTWDCGYAAPTARMQYTASSFAQPIVELFAPVLRTRTDEVRPVGLLPDRGSSGDRDAGRRGGGALQARVSAPLARLAERLHWLQQGRVQLYVLYIALTLLVLLVWKLGLGR